MSILDLLLFSPPNLPEWIGNDIALKNSYNKLHFPPSNINMFFMDDLRFLFILLKLVIIYFVHQQKRRATLRIMRRAQKGLEFTQVVVVTVALRMQSNCSCPFKENLSNLKKIDIPNMILLFIKLMVISTLMIHLFIIIGVIYFKICNVLFALNILTDIILLTNHY